MTTAQAMVIHAAGADPVREEVELGELRPDEVLIEVENSGLCHSDWSVANNDWGNAQYPLVAGHEVVGRIVEVGDAVVGRRAGQRVGIGWFSSSDLSTLASLSGEHHRSPGNESTIIGRHGGFATHCKAQWAWATPIPDVLDAGTVGPLFCAGATVFTPILDNDVKPTDRVAVLGIGGLGHLAVKFLAAWGCEVTAFTSQGKFDEARQMGAHHVVDSRDPSSWRPLRDRFDLVLSTVNVQMDWNALVATLRPGGVLHSVGAQFTERVDVGWGPLMAGRAVTSSGLGAPADTIRLLEFCARHGIAPQIETMGMSELSAAFERLHAGDVRYRIVLENDLG